MELVRQPIYLLLMSSSALFIVVLACLPYFGLGDDQLMVKGSVLAIMLVTGLFCAVSSAAASVAHEIRTGTALAVLAKPVGRVQFLLAKYAGLAGALTLISFVNLLASLLASKMAFDAYGDTDKLGLAIFVAAVAIAYLMGGFSNYFLNRQFAADTVFSLTGMVILAFLVIAFLDNKGEWQTFGKGIDWRMIPAGILVLFALFVLAGLAIACSTRLTIVPTLAICSALFMAGLMSDYFFGRMAEHGSWLGTCLYALFPNWQQFWLVDTLETGKPGVPWEHVLKAFLYMVCYTGATITAALMLFEDRELS